MGEELGYMFLAMEITALLPPLSWQALAPIQGRREKVFHVSLY